MLDEYNSAKDFCTWTVNDGDWKVLHLMNQGVWKNTATFSQNVRELIKPTHADSCLFGNVFFSILQPGSIIEPHCGPTNVRHRLQLCLHGDEGATLQWHPKN